MPRTSVTLDPDRLLPPNEEALVVEGVEDYVSACLALRAALHEKRGLDIRVHDPVTGSWLAGVAQGYGEKRVTVHKSSAREVLRDRWNVLVPAGVSDREIIQSGLLSVELLPRNGQRFDDIILEGFYGGTYAYPSFPATLLAAMLNEYDAVRWEENSRRPLVARILRERLSYWETRETSEARRLLIRSLRDNPARLRNDLGSYKLLRSYPPELADRALGETAAVFRRAQIDPEPLDLTGLDLSGARNEIEYYLRQTRGLIVAADDLVPLVDTLSGYLLEEFDAVESIIRKHPDWLTRGLLQRIESRFTPIRGGVAGPLSTLRRLIAPSRPEAPAPAWNAERWLAWIRDQYMPYYRWLEAQRRYDEEIAGYAETFADWYYEHFIELKLGEPGTFAFNALYGEHECIRQPGTVGLVLMIDNFNYVHFDELRRLFNAADFSLQDDTPRFSLIPTATEISKAAVIAGIGDSVQVGSVGYESLVSGEWNPILQPVGKSAAYLPNTGALQDLRKLEHDLYFLNYLPIDEALHRDSREVGQEHAVIVHNYLEGLVKSVSEFTRRFNLEKRLVVYVISDHGSTRIGRDVVSVLNKRWYRDIAALRHRRYIQISEEQLADLPQMVDAQCYIIQSDRFGTKSSYLAARGYYRFSETSEDFFVHGGLTPEEVVVPFARFELKPVHVAPPDLRLLSSQFRYAVRSAIEVEIGNPNDYYLENILVRVQGLDAPEIPVDSLPPRERRSVAIPVVFRKEPGAGNTRSLTVRTRYECQGKLFEPEDTEFTITMKSLMEVVDDFDL